MARKQVTEDDVMKALGALEDEAQETEVEETEVEEKPAKAVAKSGARTALPGSTQEANGGKGLSKDKGGTGKKADVDVEADEKEPVAKSAADEADEEIEADEEEEMVEEVEAEEEIGKSASALRENDTIRKGVEVSPFLESLVDVFGSEMDRVNKSVEEFASEQNVFNAKLQKALIALGNTVVQIASKVDAFGDEPARTRKSVLTKSEVQERDFEGQRKQETQFSKSQVLNVMTEMVVKGELPGVVVSTYETTDFIPPEYVGKVEKALKAG